MVVYIILWFIIGLISSFIVAYVDWKDGVDLYASDLLVLFGLSLLGAFTFLIVFLMGIIMFFGWIKPKVMKRFRKLEDIVIIKGRKG